MKRLPLLLAGILLAMPGAAAPSMKVTSKTTAGADLSSYATYSWLPAAAEDSGPLVAAGTTLAAVIEEVGDRELAKLGMEKAPAGEAQIVLRYQGIGRDIVRPGAGKAGIDPNMAWIASDGQSPSVQEGSLVIEAVDAKTDEVLWLGWATDIIEVPPKRSKIERKASRATRRILQLLPRD